MNDANAIAWSRFRQNKFTAKSIISARGIHRECQIECAQYTPLGSDRSSFAVVSLVSTGPQCQDLGRSDIQLNSRSDMVKDVCGKLEEDHTSARGLNRDRFLGGSGSKPGAFIPL